MTRTHSNPGPRSATRLLAVIAAATLALTSGGAAMAQSGRVNENLVGNTSHLGKGGNADWARRSPPTTGNYPVTTVHTYGHRIPWKYGWRRPGSYLGYGYAGYGYGGYWYGPYYGYRPFSRYYGPIDGQLSPVYTGVVIGAQQQPPEPPPPPTTFERARMAMFRGNAEQAITLYRQHLDELEAADATEPRPAAEMPAAVMRELAMALIAKNRVGDGVALMRLAYETDPTLAEQRLDAGALVPDRDEWRDLLRPVVRMANDGDAASAWLTVVVMMQAEGRDEVALRNLSKAEAAYLDPELVARLRTALEH